MIGGLRSSRIFCMAHSAAAGIGSNPTDLLIGKKVRVWQTRMALGFTAVMFLVTRRGGVAISR